MGTIVIVIIIVAVVALALTISNDNSKRQANALALTSIEGFDPEVRYDGGTSKNGVAIDPKSNQFAVIIGTTPKVYRFTDLVSVEVVRDGNALTKSNRGSQVVGAAVGAALLGPVGLLLGGLTGSKRQVEKVKRLSLKLYTNDLKSPVTEICFLDMPSPIKADGFIVTTAGKLLDEWYGRFQTILHSRP